MAWTAEPRSVPLCFTSIGKNVPGFDAEFDYLTLFGLDPSAVVRMPLASLRDRVQARRKEWTAQAVNPLYQQQARANLERAKQFEALLRDGAAFEAYLKLVGEIRAAERRRQLAELGPLVRLAAGPGGKLLTSEQRELLLKQADERGIPPALLDELLKDQHIQVRDSDQTPSGPAYPYQQPAIEKALLKQVHAHLRVLGKSNFYTLLDLPQKTPPARLISVAQTLLARWSKTLPKTAETVAWEKGLQAAITYLKDPDQKARYDRGLFNERVDEFLKRIDLVLAAGPLNKDAATRLALCGVEEFGFDSETVNRSVQLRAASKGRALARPVHVSVQTAGQVQCPACWAWNPTSHGTCTPCGSTLRKHCRNPECQRVLPADARVCGDCHLSVSRGPQYAELLRLAKAALESGAVKLATDACRMASQILPGGRLEALAQQAAQVRTLSAGIRRAAVDKRWSLVERELPKLLALAPRYLQPGVPDLEEVSTFLLQMRQKLSAARDADDDPQQARVLLGILHQWTDAPDVLEHLSALCDRFERHADFASALEIARPLAERDPLNEAAQERVVRIEHKLADAENRRRSIDETVSTFRRAVDAARYYSALRAAERLEVLAATHTVGDPAIATVRARIDEVGRELSALRAAAASGLAARDSQRTAYLQILERCRDCREALAALQSIPPDPPAPPDNVRVDLQGSRRVVRWEPSPGKRPSEYRIVRELQRPGGRPAETSTRSIPSGGDCAWTDDEVLHNGVVVRYSVTAVLRGRLEVDGVILQDFEEAAVPVAAEPLLLWQEVLGLRLRGLPAGVELTWHVPAGVRQVLADTWEGSRDDAQSPHRPLIVTEAGRLLVEPLSPGVLHSFRLRSVYDAPGGEFVTPGVVISGGVSEHDAPLSSAPDTNSDNERIVLKRLKIWPPAAGGGELGKTAK